MKPLSPTFFAGCVLVSAISLGGLAQADTDAGAGAAACPPADAQKSDKPKLSAAAEFMKKRWGKIDTNRDGIIGKDEYLKEAADRFDASDLNHDGKLTPEEIKTFFDKMEADKAQRDKDRNEKAKLCASKLPKP